MPIYLLVLPVCVCKRLTISPPFPPLHGWSKRLKFYVLLGEDRLAQTLHAGFSRMGWSIFGRRSRVHCLRHDVVRCRSGLRAMTPQSTQLNLIRSITPWDSLTRFSCGANSLQPTGVCTAPGCSLAVLPCARSQTNGLRVATQPPTHTFPVITTAVWSSVVGL